MLKPLSEIKSWSRCSQTKKTLSEKNPQTVMIAQAPKMTDSETKVWITHLNVYRRSKLQSDLHKSNMQHQARIQECWDRDLELLISVFKYNYPVQTMTILRITWDRWWHDAISDTPSYKQPVKWRTLNKSLARWCCHFIVS